MRLSSASLAAVLALAAACSSSGSGDDDTGGDDDGDDLDGGPGSDGDGGAVAGCPRSLAPDGPRRVVVSHPFSAEGDPATLYRELTLAADGALSPTERTFSMGRATYGEIAFTPDGALAFAAQDDGSIGVVAFDGDGDAPRVVEAALDAGMSAGAVSVSPGGDRLIVLDQQWREHGGGVYSLPIGCDGALGAATELAPARLPEELIALPDDRLLVVSRDVLDSEADHDVHLLEGGAAPAVLASVDAFPDDEAIVSSAALTADGRFALIADNSELSGIPNRIAAIEIAGDGLISRQILAPIEDPFAVVASPFGGAALVVSGYGDALFALDIDDAELEPLSIRGELDYVGGAPQLPGDAVMIERGVLRGLVLVVEVEGVRRVRFGEAAAVSDLGVTAVGDGELESLIGAIGVAP